MLLCRTGALSILIVYVSQQGWDIKRADSCMQCMCTAGACILFFSPIGSWLILSAEPVYAFLLKPVFTFFVS